MTVQHAPRILALGGLALLAVGLGLFLGALAIRDLAWTDTGHLLASLNPLLMLSALVLVLAAGYLRAIRWKVLLDPEAVSVSRLYLIEQTGTAMDTFSLVHLLDEVVETGILVGRDHVPTGKVLATLAMQRTLEFGTIVLVLGGVAIALEPLSGLRPYLAGGVASGIASLLLLFTVGPALIRFPVLGRLSVTRQFANAALLLRGDWRRTSVAFVLSVAQSVLTGAAGWLLGIGLGVPLGGLDMLAVTLGVLFFGSTVPGLPLALGTYEFAAVSLFALWDRSAAEAVSFTILLRANVYLPPLIMAAVFLSREGILSLRGLMALVQEARRSENRPN